MVKANIENRIIRIEQATPVQCLDIGDLIAFYAPIHSSPSYFELFQARFATPLFGIRNFIFIHRSLPNGSG